MDKKFLESIKPVNPEYSDILGEVGDFKTKEGYSYSKLIYAKITKLEELSEGHRYGKINTVKVEMGNGNIEIFAEKINNTNDGNFDAIQTLEKHRRLKGIGAETLDQMFIAKGGKVIISTLLNKDKRVAVSFNDTLSSFSQGKKINYQEIFNKKLKIKNLEEVLKSLLEQPTLASQVGLRLAPDCLFFLVPEDHNNKPVGIDFLIGDFDVVKINDFRKNNLAYLSLENLRNNIIYFIERYIDDSLKYKPEYLKLIQKILNPELKINQIMTKDGVKDLIDYTEKDGEVLKSNLEDPDENTSWKEIEKLSQVSSATINLTNIKIEFKEKITFWRGALIDESLKFHYPLLQTVGGYLNAGDIKSFSVNALQTVGENLYIKNVKSFSANALQTVGENLYVWNTKSFSANALQTVGEDLDAGNAKSFSANALQTIGGGLDVENTKNFLVKNLSEVQSIHLTKSNFLEYWQDDTFDWDKAYRDNRLVLKEELREKVMWG